MRAFLSPLLVALLATACREPEVAAEATRSHPGRPAACREVAPGEPIQPILDDAEVAAVCLAPGSHTAPLVLARAVTLWGPPEAIVHAARPGSTIVMTGAGAALLGLTIDGAGGRFDQADAAVKVAGADIRVEGVTVLDAMFGISVENGVRVRIVGNHVHGGREVGVGLRGDTIRLWETRDSIVADNLAEDGRDFVIFYSRGNRVTGNEVRRGRYGLHFMYSHDNEVARNRLLASAVGIFVMYSRGVHIHDNVVAGAGDATTMGIGLKDSGNVTLRANLIAAAASGIYLDASPLQLGDRVVIERNQLRLHDRAIVFHSTGHRVAIRDNTFADNGTQVAVDGGGDALDVETSGNYFDDYEGYDLDGDGRGDVPYELRSLSNQLTSSHPQVALFHGTPALAIVEAAGRLDPLYQPKAILADPVPRMSELALEEAAR